MSGRRGFVSLAVAALAAAKMLPGSARSQPSASHPDAALIALCDRADTLMRDWGRLGCPIYVPTSGKLLTLHAVLQQHDVAVAAAAALIDHSV